MAWKKGQSGNPAGKPKGTGYYQKLLQKAIEEAQKKHKIGPVKLFVEKAYTDNELLKALMRKILPDKKIVDASVSGDPDKPLMVVFFGEKKSEHSKPKVS